MTTDLVVRIVGWVLPVLLGPIVYVVAKQALNVHAAVDALPPIVKRVIVTVLGAAIVVAFNALGLALPAECANDPSAQACAAALSAPALLKGVVAAVVAMVMHALKQSRPGA